LKTIFFIVIISLILLACGESTNKNGEVNEGCKSDNTCEKNLYCNLENKKCEPCSVKENILSLCEEGECLVSQGNFCMGCQEIDGVSCNEDELPYHKIFLTAYKIDQYEVTASQYKECVQAGKCEEKNIYLEDSNSCNYGVIGKENHPMNCINWLGAEQYCKWKKKRLPTEAEWEKAARGNDGRIYPWNNNNFGCAYSIVDIDNIPNNNNEGCEQNSTSEVGFIAGISPYGLHDVSGNVMEWVNDYYSNTYYSEIGLNDTDDFKEMENPQGPKTGNSKVLRGGGWRTFGEFAYTFRRERYIPSFGHDDYGFRCVQDIK
jgi:formylglycine-generating enzyme required for sulfatase activity